jgi:hypothetical protein
MLSNQQKEHALCLDQAAEKRFSTLGDATLIRGVPPHATMIRERSRLDSNIPESSHAAEFFRSLL